MNKGIIIGISVFIGLSCTGMLSFYYFHGKREQKLANSQLLYCQDGRENPNPSLATISDLKNRDEYLDFIHGRISIFNFKGTFLAEGKDVHVLGYSSDSILVQIAVVNKNNHRITQRGYEELWIWHGFLTSEISRK
jgi:hypothetical protein